MGRINRPKKTLNQVIEQARKIRRKIFWDKLGADTRTEKISEATKMANTRYRNAIIGFVLGELGTKDAEKKRLVSLVFEKKPNLLESALKDVKAAQEIRLMKISRTASLDQTEAAQRTTICQILGKQDGELFWKKFKELRGKQ